MTREPIKEKGKCMRGKLKMCKERIKTIFMVNTLNMTCIAMQQQWQSLTLYTNKIKVAIVRYMLKSVNTLMQKASNVTYLVIQIMNDFLMSLEGYERTCCILNIQ